MNQLGKAAVQPLTPRQKEILQLILEGLDSAEIAGQLGIAVETVRVHTKTILRKNHVHSKLELLAKRLGHD